MHRRWQAALAVMAVLAWGCHQGSEPAGPLMPDAPDVSIDPSSRARIDEFSRLLALGMRDPAARAALHRSLRLSPVYEHKVVLSSFLETAEGAVVLASIAAASGRDLPALRSLAARLPTLQLYVPIIRDRRSWRSGEPIGVASAMGTETQLKAYTADGNSFPVDATRFAPELPMALLLLGPDEPMGVRRTARPMNSLVATAGEFIEGPEEWSNAACLEGCEGDGGGGGGGGSGGGTTEAMLHVDSIIVYHVCDHGRCLEGNEFQIWAGTVDGVPGRNLWCYGVHGAQWGTPPNEVRALDHCTYDGSTWIPQNVIHELRPDRLIGREISVDMKELNSGVIEGDDHFGWYIGDPDDYWPYDETFPWVTVRDNSGKRMDAQLSEEPADHGDHMIRLILKW